MYNFKYFMNIAQLFLFQVKIVLNIFCVRYFGMFVQKTASGAPRQYTISNRVHQMCALHITHNYDITLCWCTIFNIAKSVKLF